MLEVTTEAFEEQSICKVPTKESELFLLWRFYCQGKIDNIPKRRKKAQLQEINI